MAEFVLKNNYFEFYFKDRKQISDTAIGTKFAPTYTCIFMDKAYIDMIFFIWTKKEEKLETFLKQFNAFHPDLRFKYEKSKFSVNFLDVQFFKQ